MGPVVVGDQDAGPADVGVEQVGVGVARPLVGAQGVGEVAGVGGLRGELLVDPAQPVEVLGLGIAVDRLLEGAARGLELAVGQEALGLEEQPGRVGGIGLEDRHRLLAGGGEVAGPHPEPAGPGAHVGGDVGRRDQLGVHRGGVGVAPGRLVLAGQAEPDVGARRVELERLAPGRQRLVGLALAGLGLGQLEPGLDVLGSGLEHALEPGLRLVRCAGRQVGDAEGQRHARIALGLGRDRGQDVVPALAVGLGLGRLLRRGLASLPSRLASAIVGPMSSPGTWRAFS